MADLVVYGSPVSPFVRKVEVVLRDQGVDYDFENVNIMDMLDGNDYFVGGAFSIADIAVGAQMTQLDLVAGTPDAGRWPGLVRHTQAMKGRRGFAENLAVCQKMLGRMLPEKVDLSGGP